MDWMAVINEAVVRGKRNEIEAMAAQAVEEGIPAQSLINEGLIPAMHTVSELWRNEEYYIPEVLRSAKTMQAGVDALRPHLVSGDHGKGVRIAIGTVKGDLHDIGKNLVCIMLEGVGFEVENLGVDLPAERFLEAAKAGARVIGMSSLLTTSMGGMKSVIELFQESGLREGVTLMVGGAPITKEFADRIGADYYAEHAAEAVRIVNDLFG